MDSPNAQCIHQTAATRDVVDSVFGAGFGRWLTYDEIAPYYERLSYTLLLRTDGTDFYLSELYDPARVHRHKRPWFTYYALPHPEAVVPVPYWRSTLLVGSGSTEPVICAVRVEKSLIYWWEYFILPRDLDFFKKCKKNNPKSTIMYHQTAR